MERDYVKYPNLGRPPKTLHECFRVDPLGCSNYPAYCRKVEALKLVKVDDLNSRGNDAEMAKRGR